MHPGYGLPSKNPDLAEACAEAGITFLGLSKEPLELMSSRAFAIVAAKSAGAPALTSVEPSTDVERS